MNDTNPKITERMQSLFQKKSPEERLRMGCSMYDASRRIVVASILQRKPQPTPSDLRCEIFLRFYGNDFNTTAERSRILEHLAHLSD